MCMCSEKPILIYNICVPPRFWEVSPVLRWKQFQCLSDWWCSSLVLWRRTSCTSFSLVSLLHAIDGVMSLAFPLCPQVVSWAPQRFRSSEKQATCEGCFALQSVCSVISLHSSTSRAVYPQKCVFILSFFFSFFSSSTCHFVSDVFLLQTRNASLASAVHYSRRFYTLQDLGGDESEKGGYIHSLIVERIRAGVYPASFLPMFRWVFFATTYMAFWM